MVFRIASSVGFPSGPNVATSSAGFPDELLELAGADLPPSDIPPPTVPPVDPPSALEPPAPPPAAAVPLLAAFLRLSCSLMSAPCCDALLSAAVFFWPLFAAAALKIS